MRAHALALLYGCLCACHLLLRCSHAATATGLGFRPLHSLGLGLFAGSRSIRRRCGKSCLFHHLHSLLLSSPLPTALSVRVLLASQWQVLVLARVLCLMGLLSLVQLSSRHTTPLPERSPAPGAGQRPCNGGRLKQEESERRRAHESLNSFLSPAFPFSFFLLPHPRPLPLSSITTTTTTSNTTTKRLTHTPAHTRERLGVRVLTHTRLLLVLEWYSHSGNNRTTIGLTCTGCLRLLFPSVCFPHPLSSDDLKPSDLKILYSADVFEHFPPSFEHFPRIFSAKALHSSKSLSITP